jgi:hypothetical protein
MLHSAQPALQVQDLRLQVLLRAKQRVSRFVIETRPCHYPEDRQKWITDILEGSPCIPEQGEFFFVVDGAGLTCLPLHSS